MWLIAGAETVSMYGHGHSIRIKFCKIMFDVLMIRLITKMVMPTFQKDVHAKTEWPQPASAESANRMSSSN